MRHPKENVRLWGWMAKGLVPMNLGGNNIYYCELATGSCFAVVQDLRLKIVLISFWNVRQTHCWSVFSLLTMRR